MRAQAELGQNSDRTQTELRLTEFPYQNKNTQSRRKDSRDRRHSGGPTPERLVSAATGAAGHNGNAKAMR